MLERSGVVEAVIDCYRGDCSNCDEHSFVCKEGVRWSRPFLDVTITHKTRRCIINATRIDLAQLRKALNIRLGPAAIDKTSNNATQNKSEAVMKGIKKAVPKQLNFKRNYHARVNSATHSMNNGVGSSIVNLCKASGVPVSGPVLTRAKKLDMFQEKNRERKMTHAYKLRRRIHRQNQYRLWDLRKERERPGYLKNGALEDVLYVPPADLASRDHNYQCNKVTVLQKYW